MFDSPAGRPMTDSPQPEALPGQNRTANAPMLQPLSYVLITPARNEAALIGLTLRSVTQQTLRPMRWVIVSDGSTDGTDEIVKKYAAEHEWIELVRLPQRKERHFAGKVLAFNAGYAKVKHLQYGIIGNLDADISFEPDYFSFLLSQFQLFPRLGVAGTAFNDAGYRYNYRFTGIEHVSGGCQLFRRHCFEEIGGYLPVKGGGIDLIAVVTARMRGWHTRTFTEKVFEHHRIMGSANEGAAMAKFRLGQKDYALGGHPLWELFRSIYQMGKEPFVIGGCALFAGYLLSAIRRVPRPVSREFIRFRSREQMRRFWGLFKPGVPASEAAPVAPGSVAMRFRYSAVSGIPAPMPAPTQSGLEEWVSERRPFISKLPGHSTSSDCRRQPAESAPHPSAGGQKPPAYVLVTAARNEAAFIEKTLLSVIAQTVRPLRWVIVSDGSWDGTDEIVARYAGAHSWIQLMRMPGREARDPKARNFSGKARAINTACATLKDLPYDFIANLDADISFGADHFEFLLEQLAANPALGLVGTAFRELGELYNYRIVGLEHVSGQCQLFRRECWEALDGYQPVNGGGIDVIAVTTAQMMGWGTRTFLERCFEHHRFMGSARISISQAKFRDGIKDYSLGGHPVWQLGRSFYQMSKPPLLIGGCMLLAGYAWSALRGAPRPVTRQFVRFRRRAQMHRLWGLLIGKTELGFSSRKQDGPLGVNRLSQSSDKRRVAGERLGSVLRES